MSRDTERTLLLLRHGKSAWGTDAPDDYSRPLKQRGREAAARIGGWLHHNGFCSPRIISSGALRARGTAQLAAGKLGLPRAAIEIDDRIYAAAASTLLDLCAECDDHTEQLLLVGHNPGVEQLCGYLGGNAVEPGANGKLMPTAALAVISFYGTWDKLSPDTAHRVLVVRPRELAAST